VQVEGNAARQDRADLRSLLTKLVGNYPEIRHRFSLHSDEDEDLAMAVMERVRECSYSCPMKN